MGNVLVLLQVNQDKIPFAGKQNYGEAGVQKKKRSLLLFRAGNPWNAGKF